MMRHRSAILLLGLMQYPDSVGAANEACRAGTACPANVEDADDAQNLMQNRMRIQAHEVRKDMITMQEELVNKETEIKGTLVANPPESPQAMEQATLICDGRSPECEVLLDVPQACINLGGTSDCSIVLFLHGSGGTNKWFPRTSGVHEEKMIGIYPQGDGGHWNIEPSAGNSCEWDDFACTEDPNEGDFIARIIAEVRARGALGNIYVKGNSNGAALAHRLAVNAGETLPIKGIVATVRQLLASPQRSGPGNLNYNQPQSDGLKVSILTILGTADSLIPYEGGSSAIFGGDESFHLMSAMESNEAWAAHNGCNVEPVTSTVTSNLGDGTATFYQYGQCQGGTFVEHYAVNGGAHDVNRATLGGRSPEAVFYDFVKRCENSNSSPAGPIPAGPIPAGPRPPQEEPCTDDPQWHGKFNAAHTCDYISNNPSTRCDWESSEGVPASKACPVACDACSALSPSPVPTPSPEPPQGEKCVDDPNWHGKFNVAHTCDYISNHPSKRCNWESSEGVLALEACPVACDACDALSPNPVPTSSPDPPQGMHMH